MMGLSQNSNIKTQASNPSNLELLVEKKFKEMEERMMNRIDDRIRNLEIKLDENHRKLVSMFSEKQ